MPSTHISDARGLTHAGGNGLYISSDVKITGDTTFLGTVSGITADAASRVAETGAPVGAAEYSCAGNVRYFRHTAAPKANWQANFTGLSLQNQQGVTIKISLPTAESVECYLEDVLIDGEPVSAFLTSSMHGIKIKKGGKNGIITFDIMKNDQGNVHVYADILQDLVA